LRIIDVVFKALEAAGCKPSMSISYALIGPVKIGGDAYDCIAVECTQIPKPTIHAGEPIGLVVQEVRR
jgi:hypothetical protein